MSGTLGSTIRLPRTLPIIALPNTALLPATSVVITLRDDLQSGKVADRYFWEQDRLMSLLGVVPLLSSPDVPMEGQKLNNIGTAARVTKITRFKKSGGPTILNLHLEGICRFSIDNISFQPQRVAKVTQLDMFDDEASEDIYDAPSSLEAVSVEFKKTINELLRFIQSKTAVASRLESLVANLPIGVLCDMFVSAIEVSFEEKLLVLNTVDILERSKISQELIDRQLKALKMASRLPDSSNSPVDRTRDVAVRRKMPLLPQTEESNTSNMKEEDDEGDADETSAPRLKAKIEQAQMPLEAKRIALSELKKIVNMEKTHNTGPEHQKSVTYLECLTSLPWAKSSAALTKLEIKSAKECLDQDHFGLEKIKQRILEYLAVRWLNPEARGSILCFVGPPGVGKTSLGKSIAKTLGRSFHRIALGGVRDEADVRGFNRTYIGSQPGRIIQGLRRVGCNDPVIMLDEIDKLTRNSGVTGDPSAALLEVLDPAQNDSFTDHYINTAFDLSKVVFIATANTKDTIPEALLDRMEVIELTGYTIEEKKMIAARHLVPRLFKDHGLSDHDLSIPADTIACICEQYTREPGVRSLERQIAAVCRAAAVQVMDRESKKGLPSEKITVLPGNLAVILGAPFYQGVEDLVARLDRPGVSIGLAASQLGGSVMFVEVAKMPGNGQLVLTGNLGEIIKESARIAIGWIKSHSAQSGVTIEKTEKIDLHIHFPEGSVGKDGPSGGIALTVALISCLSERLVRNDTAMTGEITLTGNVLPVGGVVQKVLAAHRRGIRRVILPKYNCQYNVPELPKNVRDSMEFISASHIDDVLPHIFVARSKL